MSDFLERAQNLDAEDTLANYRHEFLFPQSSNGEDVLYFAGNSLGLQPKKARQYILQELDDWARLGVEGHLQAKNPWLPYHEFLTEMTARLVGAKAHEVVVMNSLTVNLHLMMVSFYKPTKERFKILMEGGAFPSDQYAVQSQIRFHGYDPATAIVEIFPRSGETLLRKEDILARIEEEGSNLALVMLGNVNYLTGQCFDIKSITEAGHRVGARVGFDLAHGAGNLHLKLHDDGPDFAVWCSYKYLNAGPGAIAGCFVHERHKENFSLSRFSGWWGHNKETRFKMGPHFDCLPGAEGWQISNPPIFQLAALRSSLELFDSAGMKALRNKADALTQFLEEQLLELPQVKILSPSNLTERGTQLSLVIKGHGKELLEKLLKHGVICDFREPNVFRIAPAPLYTRFVDMVRLVEVLKKCLQTT